MVGRVTEEQRDIANKLFHEQGISRRAISRRLGISYTMAWLITNPDTKHFRSYAEYVFHQRQSQGFSSRREYQEFLASERGFENVAEYLDSLREDREKNSLIRDNLSASDYEKYLAKERAVRNYVFGEMVRTRLERLGKNQSWLAREFGVSREAVSNYVCGESLPNRKRRKRVYELLKVPIE